MLNIITLLTAFVAAGTPAETRHEAVVAGIDAGAKGTKAVVLGRAPDGAPKVLWSKTLDPTPLANLSPEGRMTEDAIRRTAAAVTELVRAIRAEFGLPDARIHVVGSSGLAGATNRDLLAVAVRRETGLNLRFLSAADEAILVHRGVVPLKERHTTMTIDVGSGNTRVVSAGWSAGVGEWYVHDTLPVGTVTLTNRITASVSARGGSWLSGLAAERVELARQIGTMADNHPTLTHHRPKCCLTGGIAWAVSAAMNPAAVRDPFVTLTAVDLEGFEKLLAAHPDEMPPVDFSAVPDPTVRAEAEAEWRRVRDTFSAKNLRAGYTIFREFASAYRLDQKEVVFARGGQFAWITALASDQLEPVAATPSALPRPAWLPMACPAPAPFVRCGPRVFSVRSRPR